MLQQLEDTRKGGLDSRWFHGVEDPERFKTQLTSQTFIWKQMTVVLKELWRNAHTEEYDLGKPNIHERMLFNEGYKKALADVYKLLPTQRETTP